MYLKDELNKILKNTTKIDFKGVILHLVSQEEFLTILEFEHKIKAYHSWKNIKKRDSFFDYAKIINPQYPCYKYSLNLKHKRKEIFNPDKVREAIPVEFSMWKKKLEKNLQKKIDENTLSNALIEKLQNDLEKEIEITEKKLDKVLSNFEKYETVITTYEQQTYYPVIYYSLKLGKTNTISSETHLRKNVPNILWYEEKNHKKIYKSDRINKIINSYDRYCDSIYIKEKPCD